MQGVKTNENRDSNHIHDNIAILLLLARSEGLTDALEANVEGPAREGIQNQPSVRRPSSATLDSALQNQSTIT